MTAFWLLLLFVASTVLVLRACRARSISNKAAGPTYPPGLEPYPLIGHLPQFLANRHRTMDWLADALGHHTTCTFVLRWPGGVRGVVTASPANVEHVLRARFGGYPKGARVTTSSLLHDFLGAGIFNADGDPWRAQRKVASHEFSTRSLRAFVARTVHAELHGRLREMHYVHALREMHYVHAAITEAMRLYPPVPVTSLQAEADDVLPDGGTAVEAGWFVVCSSYAMGRMGSVWGAEAREYRPERWLDLGPVWIHQLNFS